MRAALLLSLAAMAFVAPVLAGDGPAPPSAPTPDEAAAAMARAPSAGQPSPDQAKPDQIKPDQAKPDQAKPDQAKPDQAKNSVAKPDAVDANAEGVRKAQENGSYKMKDGGMYQPPETRPAPLWNKGYGRT